MKYDVIIIGAGPGGYVSAIRLGQMGKKVLVVEKKYIGGICLNEGCIPTKALIYASYLKEKLNYAKKEMGFHFGEERIDIEKLKKWKDKIVERLRVGIEALWKNYNVEWVKGEATLLNSNTVEVNSAEGKRVFNSDFIIIATGSKPLILPFFDVDEELIWTSATAIFLHKIPAKLLILGGGAIGLELAYVYKNLGSEVEIYEMMPQIIPGNDREIAEEYKKILLRKGIKIFLEAKALSVEKKGNSVVLTVKMGEKEEKVPGDALLLAVGRVPNLDNINLKAVGLQVNKNGFLSTDNQMRTSVPNIFAIGDITGPPLLAHKASKQGIVAAEAIAGLPTEYEPKCIPNVVYTEPQFASIGFSEEDVKNMGINYHIGKFPFIANGKAVSHGETAGLIKIIAETPSNKILGFHILGSEASSLIGEGIIAMEMESDVHNLAKAIHPHPSLCEAIMEAAENYFGKAIHILNRSSILE